jgi:peptidoglycan hydrolase-like protein with peptidoglycan-binding domain
MNRVFTGFYRNSGYDFDITNSPAYDQTYIYQRDIYENISEIVDEIFNSYIKREGFIEPLFAVFCDGVEVNCDGLKQWGSVELANQGLNYEQILKEYYGDDIVIVTDVPIDDIPSTAPPVPLQEGDTGRDVELLQRQLNRISVNFPGIPKIYPADGFFDISTTEAVKKFQEVFSLEVDGIVGKATWNRVQLVYNSVKNLYYLNSEGLTIDDLATTFENNLSIGDSGDGVLSLQYYLSYIALFVPSVIAANLDGSFGENTKNSVVSFQKTYSLNPNGIVDRATWDKIENVYLSFANNTDFTYEKGTLYPFPGRILREGVQGNDVRILQEYLNYLASYYPSIPTVTADGIFGPKTAEQVSAFKTIFNLPGTKDRVNAPTWNAISNVYDDLYTGNIVNDGQYPGNPIGG